MRVLVVYKHENSQFIRNDIEVLRKHYDVVPFLFQFKKIFLLIHELRRCDVVFIWFCSYHAWVTALLTRKPLVVVPGGYDVAGEKDIGYGLMLNPIYKRMVRFVLLKAKKILSVSEFNNRELRWHLGITWGKVSYNSVDCERFKPGGKKTTMVLTVGSVNEETWIRKGLNRFVELAKYADANKPGEMQFMVVGKIHEKMMHRVEVLNRQVTGLFFTGFVPDDDLVRLYQMAKVYCQLSVYESFGVSLAEAMACECVPVVSCNSALAEVVGDKGFFVCDENLSSLYEVVKDAMHSGWGAEAKARVKTLFTLDAREHDLMEAIDSCVQ